MNFILISPFTLFQVPLMLTETQFEITSFILRELLFMILLILLILPTLDTIP